MGLYQKGISENFVGQENSSRRYGVLLVWLPSSWKQKLLTCTSYGFWFGICRLSWHRPLFSDLFTAFSGFPPNASLIGVVIKSRREVERGLHKSAAVQSVQTAGSKPKTPEE